MNIAVIFGGESTEHDVSILTGLSVMKNLSEKYTIIPIYIARNGTFLTGVNLKQNKTFEDEVRGKICYFMPNDGYLYIKNRLKTQKVPITCAVLCLHGGIGEGGGVQGLLDVAKIPYTSCSSFVSGLCMNKALTKLVASVINISTLPFVTGKDDIMLKFHESELDFPVIVKPNSGGSSIGISIAHNEAELNSALNLAMEFDSQVLIEPALSNFRELSVAALVGDKIEFSNIEEVVCQNLYNFENKYENNLVKRIVPAKISEDIVAKMRGIVSNFCNITHIFGCVRFDFLLADQIYLNEVNTIPGNMAFYLWDFSYTHLLNLLIENAIKRQEKQKSIKKSIKTNLLKNLEKIQKITKK